MNYNNFKKRLNNFYSAFISKIPPYKEAIKELIITVIISLMPFIISFFILLLKLNDFSLAVSKAYFKQSLSIYSFGFLAPLFYVIHIEKDGGVPTTSKSYFKFWFFVLVFIAFILYVVEIVNEYYQEGKNINILFSYISNLIFLGTILLYLLVTANKNKKYMNSYLQGAKEEEDEFKKNYKTRKR